jgi:four helix bundle protein
LGGRSNSFRDLDVWKKAIFLAKKMYELTEKFPSREAFGLSNQLRRSAVSVASNIAEGQARNSKKEFLYFLNVSVGSLAEIETQLIIAKEIGYVSEEIQDQFLLITDELTRMVKGLMNHLKGKDKF